MTDMGNFIFSRRQTDQVSQAAAVEQDDAVSDGADVDSSAVNDPEKLPVEEARKKKKKNELRVSGR